MQANSVHCLTGLPHRKEEQRFYLMEWESRLGGKTLSGTNHFVSGLEKPVRIETYLGWMREAGFSQELFLTRGNDSALKD